MEWDSRFKKAWILWEYFSRLWTFFNPLCSWWFLWALQLFFTITFIWVYLHVDIVNVDALARWKISKCHFFKDIANSFHEVTHLSLEPHHFFSFQNISTNTIARDVQSFSRMGCGRQTVWAMTKFFLSNLHRHEHLLKISRKKILWCQPTLAHFDQNLGRL